VLTSLAQDVDVVRQGNGAILARAPVEGSLPSAIHRDEHSLVAVVVEHKGEVALEPEIAWLTGKGALSLRALCISITNVASHKRLRHTP